MLQLQPQLHFMSGGGQLVDKRAVTVCSGADAS